MGRVKLSVGNDLATELGNDRDAMLRALAERSGVEAYLRGNELTLDGEDDAVERARTVVVELSQLVDEGVSVGPQTVDAVAGVLTETAGPSTCCTTSSGAIAASRSRPRRSARSGTSTRSARTP